MYLTKLRKKENFILSKNEKLDDDIYYAYYNIRVVININIWQMVDNFRLRLWK